MGAVITEFVILAVVVAGFMATEPHQNSFHHQGPLVVEKVEKLSRLGVKAVEP
jgi:hypothetical protein